MTQRFPALLLAVLPMQALSANFDWDSLSPAWADGQAATQTFNNVDGTTVDITVTVTGDTNRLNNGAPSLENTGGTNNELRLSADFDVTSPPPPPAPPPESVTTTFTFSEPVNIESLSIKDIDSGSFSDTVRIEGFSGLTSVAANNVVPGLNVVEILTNYRWESNGGSYDFSDLEGWLSVEFSTGTLIDRLEITYGPGPQYLPNPTNQWIAISDFEFFTAASSATEDLSDAPSTYGLATHTVPSIPILYLGATPPDAELSLPPSTADGDDNDNIDDEEGVEFTASGDDTQTITASVTVTKTQDITGTPRVRLCGWLDIPGATGVGTFENAEGRCTSLSLDAGVEVIDLVWTGMPTDQIYTTYARFRVTSDLPLGRNRTTGAKNDGEVEDYRIEFDFRPTLVTIGQVELEVAPVVQVLGRLQVNAMDRSELEALINSWQPGREHEFTGAGGDTLRRALNDYLDPDGDGEVAVIYWDTLEERGTVGFYVERRKAGSKDWQRINERLLPGLITAPMGGEYQLTDPQAISGTRYEYRLIELEARGSTRTYGPFTLQFE